MAVGKYKSGTGVRESEKEQITSPKVEYKREDCWKSFKNVLPLCNCHFCGFTAKYIYTEREREKERDVTFHWVKLNSPPFE